jgi:RNA polymerase sigma-70 factor (ECF subfamily)
MSAAAKILDLTDATLIHRITKQHDNHAFVQLFKKYYAPLCRYAYTLIKANDTAEEIVNDVFLKIWKNKEVLQINTCIQGYLIRATRNLAIDHLRKAQRQRGRAEEIIGDFEAQGYASPIERLIGQETQAIIEATIEAMPKQCKLVFRMSRDKGMTYPEIAQDLNLHIKTIETHMSRSLKILRQALREQAVLG